jgi:hypothetical protein
LLTVWIYCVLYYLVFVAFQLLRWMTPFIAAAIKWPFVAPLRLMRRWRARRAARRLARRKRLEPVTVIVPAPAGNVSAEAIIRRLGLGAEGPKTP